MYECTFKQNKEFRKSIFSIFFFRKERKLILVYPLVQASAAGLKVTTLSFLYSDFADIIDSCEL